MTTPSYKKCATCPRRIRAAYRWCFLCAKLYQRKPPASLPKTCALCSAPSSKPLCRQCFKNSDGHMRGRRIERLAEIDARLSPPEKQLPPPNPLRKIWR